MTVGGMALMARKADEVFAWRAGQPVTAAEFAAAVGALAEQLPDATHAINLCDDRYHFLVGFVAALLRKQVTLLPANRQPETVRATREAWARSYTLGDAEGVDCRADRAQQSSTLSALTCRLPAERLAAVAFSSGSTGGPTTIEKQWGTLAGGARINHRHLLAGVAASASVVATVPPQHMYGLETSVMLPLVAPVAVDSGRPLFPEDVRRALERVPPPRVLVTTPAHLRVLVRAGPYPAVERVLSATAPLSPDLARATAECFGADMLEVYGFSEAGCVATRRTATEPAWQPYPEFRFRTREDGCSVQADHIPHPVPVQDVLAFEADGRFRLVGRAADMVNIAGKRGSLAEITAHLLALEGVLDGIVFESPESSNGMERLAALVVAPGRSGAELREALRARVDPVFLPRPFLLVDALPRTAAGKLPRAAVLAAFHAVQRGR